MLKWVFSLFFFFRGFCAFGRKRKPSVNLEIFLTLRLLNALNSEDRGLKVRFSLGTIAFDRESAQMSQILSSQGKTHLQTPILTKRKLVKTELPRKGRTGYRAIWKVSRAVGPT